MNEKIREIFREEFATPTPDDPRNEQLVVRLVREIFETARAHDQKALEKNPVSEEEYIELGMRTDTLKEILMSEDTQLSGKILESFTAQERKDILSGFAEGMSGVIKNYLALLAMKKLFGEVENFLGGLGCEEEE